MSYIEILPATIEDAPQIAELIQSNLKGYAYKDLTNEQRAFYLGKNTKEQIAAKLNDKGNFPVALKAVLDGKIIGFRLITVIQESDERSDKIGHGQRLHVDPSVQKRGVGSKLVKAGEDALIGLNIKIARVGPSNQGAKDFFQKLGYSATAQGDTATGRTYFVKRLERQERGS